MISIQESGLQTILETSEPVFYATVPILSTPRRTFELSGDSSNYYYDEADQRDYLYKQVLSSILPDYILLGDRIGGIGGNFGDIMSINRVFPTEHGKYNLLFKMELMALDEKKKEIVGSNFFKSLTQTNKLLFKSASITEVYSETNVYSKKDETYYNPLFKSFSFKYDLIINIILTSILNSQTVTNTLIQTDKFEYDTPKEREIPITSPCGGREKEVYVEFNILNPTSCRVREAATEYHQFINYIRMNRECCADAGIFLHAFLYNQMLSESINNPKNKKEFKQKASDYLAKADELVQKINSDDQKFSSLQKLTLSPKIEARNQRKS